MPAAPRDAPEPIASTVEDQQTPPATLPPAISDLRAAGESLGLGSGKRDASRRRLDLFLSALALGATVADAARVAGLNRAHLYRQRDRDPWFAHEWALALESSADAVEDRLALIALEGDASSMATVRAAEVVLRARSSRHRPQPKASASIEYTGADGGRQTLRFVVGTPSPE